jgi:hypothetical protein
VTQIDKMPGNQAESAFKAAPLNRYLPFVILLFVFLFSLGTKLSVLDVGAPYVTIDDQTKYEAGFHVWFGQAPPQRMYIESWISGISSITTYVARNLGQDGAIGLNLVADAYRDFHANPDPYVLTYRSLMLFVDFLTAVLIFLLVREVARRHAEANWIAAIAASLYMLSFNTLWAYVVARPDTLTVFFAVSGLLLYYRSDFGERQKTLVLSGVFLGLATGMKLHGAFFVIFICLDLWRQLGFKEAFRRAFWFGLVAVVVFAVAAGSVVFDPALYVKLRLLNARDDASPWLEWGDQFFTILRGTGWLIVPLIAVSVWMVRRLPQWKGDPRLASVIFLSVCWLVLFASIRVLRGYWMLPALPLFYTAVAFVIVYAFSAHWRLPVLALLFGVFGTQLWFEGKAFRDVPFNELRSWVTQNVEPDDTVYILGYTALNLPLNTSAIQQHKQVLEAGFSDSVADEESFTMRHIRLWEERARHRLFDMLNFHSDVGYRYFGYNSFLPEVMERFVSFDDVNFILLQEHFNLSEEDELTRLLQAEFELTTSLTGPGGGGYGLSYDVYKRTE